VALFFGFLVLLRHHLEIHRLNPKTNLWGTWTWLIQRYELYIILTYWDGISFTYSPCHSFAREINRGSSRLTCFGRDSVSSSSKGDLLISCGSGFYWCSSRLFCMTSIGFYRGLWDFPSTNFMLDWILCCSRNSFGEERDSNIFSYLEIWLGYEVPCGLKFLLL